MMVMLMLMLMLMAVLMMVGQTKKLMIRCRPHLTALLSRA